MEYLILFLLFKKYTDFKIFFNSKHSFFVIFSIFILLGMLIKRKNNNLFLVKFSDKISVYCLDE